MDSAPAQFIPLQIGNYKSVHVCSSGTIHTCSFVKIQFHPFFTLPATYAQQDYGTIVICW